MLEQKKVGFLIKTQNQGRVRNNLGGCGGGLANLTVFLFLSSKLLQKWQIYPKSSPGDSQLSAFPHHDYSDVDWRWGWVSESNTYPQLRLTLSSRKYTELNAFGLTGNHQQKFQQYVLRKERCSARAGFLAPVLCTYPRHAFDSHRQKNDQFFTAHGISFLCMARTMPGFKTNAKLWGWGWWDTHTTGSGHGSWKSLAPPPCLAKATRSLCKQMFHSCATPFPLSRFYTLH